MYIKADGLTLWRLSFKMFTPHPSSRTQRLFSVMFDGVDGYTPLTTELEEKLKEDSIVYTTVQLPPSEPKNYIVLDGRLHSVKVILSKMAYHSRYARNLNTAVDVYFEFEKKIYGIRFQDWFFWRTLSDEECLKKVQKYLIENGEIKHPAKALA